MTRFPSKARSSLPALACVALGLYACSLQNFEYLQEGEAGAPSGGKGGSAGSSGGSSGAGGSSGSTAGSSNPSDGGGGDGAGQGGEAGIAGASGEGGAPAGGMGGTVEGGAPSAGQGGEGGVPLGSGGDGTGTGATAGTPSEGGAGGEPPVVAQPELQNPGFELGLMGWTVDPPSAALPAVRYVYTQAPNPPNDSRYALATWHMSAEYEIFVYQTLTGLEPGTYTFKGMLSTQSTREAYLFARNCGGEEIRETIYPVSFEWFEVAIESFTVSQETCEVGLFVHGMKAGEAEPDWLNADNFSFEKDP